MPRHTAAPRRRTKSAARTAAVASFALGAVAPAARADLLPVDQSRRVTASTDATRMTGPRSEESAARSATDFGSFDQTAESTQNLIELVPGFAEANAIDVAASASQSSEILPTRLRASGQLQASSFDVLGGAGTSTADSLYQVTFVLDEPHRFHLSYQSDVPLTHDLQLFAEPSGALLTRASRRGRAAGSSANLLGGGDPTSYDGTLDPGTYTLRMFESVDSLGPAIRANYVMQFDVVAVPLPPAAWMALTAAIPAAAVTLRRRAAAV